MMVTRPNPGLFAAGFAYRPSWVDVRYDRRLALSW
jgi:hypothetical protein